MGLKAAVTIVAELAVCMLRFPLITFLEYLMARVLPIAYLVTWVVLLFKCGPTF